jgi:galactose mutarotase-like enzyme
VTAQDRHSVSTRVVGNVLAFCFERTLTLGVRTLHLDYRVKNQGAGGLALLWATHPLFSVAAATRVVLGEAADVRELHETGESTPATWPEGGVSVVGALARGQGKKFFARAARGDASASLVDADGGSLTMSWRAPEVPWLGVWLDNCSLSRGPVAAIEPTNASDDSLDVAERAGQSWSLAPGSELHWSIAVSVSGSVPPA